MLQVVATGIEEDICGYSRIGEECIWHFGGKTRYEICSSKIDKEKEGKY
jgi:hypothetical protein